MGLVEIYLWVYQINLSSRTRVKHCEHEKMIFSNKLCKFFHLFTGILKMHEDVLVNMDFIHLGQFLKKLPENISHERLFKSIESIQMNIEKKKFSNILASKRDALKDLTWDWCGKTGVKKGRILWNFSLSSQSKYAVELPWISDSSEVWQHTTSETSEHMLSLFFRNASKWLYVKRVYD